MLRRGNVFVVLTFMVFMLGIISLACANVSECMSIGKPALPMITSNKADEEKPTNMHVTHDSKELTKKDKPCLEEAKKLKVQESYGNIPLSFIQNDGQMNEKVEFYERGNGHSTFFTKKGVYLSLVSGKQERENGQNKPENPSFRTLYKKSEIHNPKSEIVRFTPLGANKDPEIFAEGMQDGKVNYFSGNDPEKWKTNIPTYQSVVYKDVYDGIDMKFYGNNRQMEYDIIVNPGANPSRVQLTYQGIEGLQITEEGNLEIELKEGKIIHKKPYVYQEIAGKKIEVEGRFRVQTKNPKSETRNPKYVYGFQVASYNKQYPLVIDPVLVYSTYLGGSGYEEGGGIAIDSDGNVYIIGTTWSSDFPTVFPIYGDQLYSSDAFVTKINSTGTGIVYSTYIGGGLWNEINKGHSIAVDTAGNAYITGYTSSYSFPTVSAIYGNKNGSFDAFVSKIDASGSSLVYSTYLGGSDEDIGTVIHVDVNGITYVAGWTFSSDFPTVSSLNENNGGANDVFITKIAASGTNLLYSTYLGGNNQESPHDMAIDTVGNIYITGETRSANFPMASAIDNSLSGNVNAFVTMINAAGTSLVFSTYLGIIEEMGNGIAVDNDGNVYVTGYTASPWYPTVLAIDNSYNGNNDAFVTKFDPTGTSILFSTYLGGSGKDEGYDIEVDTAGNVYITGYTESSNFPTANPISGSNGGGADAFVTKFDSEGNMVYSTYLGGSGLDIGYDIAVDTVGNAYITGITSSVDFPVAEAIYGNNRGVNDAFVAKIGPDNICPIANAGPDQTVEQTDPSGVQVTLDGTGSSDPDGDTLTYTWTGPFGNATGPTPTVTMPPGANTVYLVVNDGTIDSAPDMVTITVQDTTAPIVSNTAANPNPVAVNTACTVTAQIDDTASNISYAEYSIDGIQWYNMDPITNGTNSVNVSVTMPGVTESKLLTVSVRGTDEEGNTSEPENIYLPVYDPSAGFVTGGGWIWSPQGAYTADTTLEGKANFGFVAKYKKGANIPDGSTEFRFTAGNLNFHSKVYEWLVVAGYKAMFKGTGTINGAGSYKFMISCVDGELKGNGAKDNFRIRIWEEDGNGGETTIYDNQMNADMDAEATTTLGGGSIIIHKGK